MIKFTNISKEEPFQILYNKYLQASSKDQELIQAICISSLSKSKNEVDSRYVNLKFIDGNEFIFFSNYLSPKAIQFKSNNRISALFFWPSINTQIRMKAKIKKTSNKFNQDYFSKRVVEKNALAISSKQSKPIASFQNIQENYNYILERNDLKVCPKYWGGFSFTPYEIEFWEGNEFRLNKRNLYKKEKNKWKQYILEP